MGEPAQPDPVKLMAGLLAVDEVWMDRALSRLQQMAGPCDLISELSPFAHTDYYQQEMGGPLQRRFVSFESLVEADSLAAWKLKTNALEQQLADDCRSPGSRRVNVDPGYVDTGKLVLATTKNAGHRIYLGDGIFAEVTLRYANGDFHPLPWTYPDYAERQHRDLFCRFRDVYLQQLRQRRSVIPPRQPEEARKESSPASHERSFRCDCHTGP